jgi:MOSC domain-containing protein YiiM
MTKASAAPTASIRSIHVGLPQTRGTTDAWTSAIYKTAVTGPVHLTRLGLHGDGHADPLNHGGPDKAVCVYSFDNYTFWIEQLSLPELPPAAFGENFTVQGLSEATICIGDVLAVGTAVVQVSQPRQPCWKLARKWNIDNFPEQVVQANRTGWYFRVTSEGTVQAGDVITLVERPHPEWTIAAANDAMYRNGHHRDASAALAAVPVLSKSWKDTLRQRTNR